MKTTKTIGMKDSWGYVLHDVSKLLKRRFEEEARAYGVTLPQWRVLAQIAVGNDSSQKALAAAIDVDPMTMSGILDRLEKRRLISRVADPTDSRAKLAAITPEGTETVENARHVGLTLLEEGLTGLSGGDREQLKSLLTRVRDNLQGEVARIKELQE